MEDEDIAPNAYLCSQYGQNVVPVQCTYTIMEYCVLPTPTGSAAYVFGAIPSSSILRPILYATFQSMDWSCCKKMKKGTGKVMKGVNKK